MPNVSYSRVLVDIEDFIFEIIKHEIKPSHFYQDLACLLLDFYEVYDSDLKYQGYINAFIELIYDFNLDELDVNDLVVELKKYKFDCYLGLFKRYEYEYLKLLREFGKSERNNTSSLLEKMDQTLKRYSKVLVVRVDLSYLKEFHHLNNIQDLNDDLRRLNKFIQNRDTVFKNCIDYAWAIEQGMDKGFHCHLVLFFNGHKRRSAFAIAKRIGEKWNDITWDQGAYFNCHASKQIRSYEEKGILGIGLIHRDDPDEVANMHNAIMYLTRPDKESQYLRVKTSKKMRTFGQSKFL